MRPERAPRGPLSVLFRDDHYIAVNKPPNLFVHRTPLSPERDVLLQRLRNQIGQRVYPVHRLDRATSGVVIFGLSSEASAALCPLFEATEVSKSYLTVVRGHVASTGVIDSPLKDDGGTERTATTHFQRLATSELPFPVGRYDSVRLSLVAVQPKTGRRHQIRRHFSRVGHPIIGDAVHGDHRQNRFFLGHLGRRRLMLTAISLRFTHPFSQERIHIGTTPDTAFLELLNAMSLVIPS